MSHNGWNCNRCTLWHPENHLQCICGYARWGTQLDTDSDEGISAYVSRNNSYAAADPVPSPGNIEETLAEVGDSANADDDLRCAIMKDYPVEGVRLIRGDGRDSRSVYDFRNLLRHLMVSGSRHDGRFLKIPTTGEWIDIGSALEYVEKVSPEEQQRINAARSDEVCHQGITLDEIISMHHWYK